jgi:hypothetical protein
MAQFEHKAGEGSAMRIAMLLSALLSCAVCGAATPPQPSSADAFEYLKSLAGEWQAELPGFGRITSSIRLVSNGKAIEETIGTADNNEVSLYTRDGNRLLLTHFCALTADGHVVRLQSAPVQAVASPLEFGLVGTSNLHSETAPHMRRVVMTFRDHDHFEERWTKTENGADTVFDLRFVRR